MKQDTNLPAIRLDTARFYKRAFAIFLMLGLIFIFAIGKWGSNLLIKSDALPSHLDGLVVLQGSILGEKARIDGAVRLLQQGRADRMMISIPHETYWGQSVAPIARVYIAKQFGQEIAARTDFCETGLDVNSTKQEAEAIWPCIDGLGEHQIAVVTSNYHTRRARIIWYKTLAKHSRAQLWIYGVPDPEFRADGWWRDRRSAKTWLFELSKLISVLLGA